MRQVVALLEAEGLKQKFNGRAVLSGVDLSIKRGEVFGLIGPTGAGKTTLLRILDLLDKPAAGHLYFDGVEVTHLDRNRFQARRRMAFVQQKPIVFSMTVFDNVACGLRWRHEGSTAIHQRVEDALERVGLMPLFRRDAKQLSGGEVQRVALARALVLDPEVLILDEPTANLDPNSLSRLEEVLMQVVKERQMTIILATHDMSRGQRLAGRIGVLMEGELLQTGTPNEVFCTPGSTKVAEFVGIQNIIEGVISHKDGELAIVEVNGRSMQVVSDLPVGECVEILLRPENITFKLSKEASSARNVYGGEIRRLTEVGSLVRIEVDCGFPLLGVITMKSAQELGFSVGGPVFASFKATAVHVIRGGSHY